MVVRCWLTLWLVFPQILGMIMICAFLAPQSSATSSQDLVNRWLQMTPKRGHTPKLQFFNQKMNENDGQARGDRSHEGKPVFSGCPNHVSSCQAQFWGTSHTSTMAVASKQLYVVLPNMSGWTCFFFQHDLPSLCNFDSFKNVLRWLIKMLRC